MISSGNSCMNIINEIIDAMHLLINNELNTLSSGNISYNCRKTGYIIITPSGVGKHSLMPRDLVYYDSSRKVFIGFRKPSTEYRVHLAVYREAIHHNAIAHAHNPIALKLYSEKGLSPFHNDKLIEARYVLGKVCMTVGEAGTQELAENIAVVSRKCDVTIVPYHGAFAFAETPIRAVEKLFALEYVAKYYINKM